MICLENFGSINANTGHQDVAAQIVGLEGCSHIFGLACLEELWSKGSSRTVGIRNHCMLDKTKWFSKSSLQIPNMTEQEKISIAQQLACFHNVGYGSARYFLFREDERAKFAMPGPVSKLWESFHFERCINFSLTTKPLREVRSILRKELAQEIDDEITDEFFQSEDFVSENFGTHAGAPDAIWQGLMDPFQWRKFDMDTSNLQLLALAALRTPKGAKLLRHIRSRRKALRDLGRLDGWESNINLDEWSDRTILKGMAMDNARAWMDRHGSEDKAMVQFMCMLLTIADVQYTTTIELPLIPGAVGLDPRSWHMFAYR